MGNSSAFFEAVQQSLGSHLMSILSAVAVIAIGWLIAVLVRAALLRVLGALRINERLSASTGSNVDVAHPIALTAFWLILLATVVVMLNVLDIQGAASPFAGMLDKVLGYLPQLFAGLVLALVAWLVAALLRGLASKALAATSLDDKLSAEAEMKPMSQNVANVIFWLVILFFLPAILGAFKLEGLLEPVQTMMDKILAMLPNIFAAVLIGFVGWVVAKVFRSVVVNLLNATGADKLSKTVGMENLKISSVAGTLVFIFVFVPILIAALDALKIEAISRPAINMLDQMMAAVPNILSAAIILTVAWFVAKFAAGLIVSLLEGVGFNELPAKVGAGQMFQSGRTPSQLVGAVIIFFAMLFASVEAANRLEFSQVRDVVTMFIEFGGQILLGGVILMVGFWLANLAYGTLSRLSGGKPTAANIVRFGIIGLVIAMGLRAMGIADDIVNLAFGLTLGAIAIAIALSFGLGGREAAGKQMEHWLSKWRGN